MNAPKITDEMRHALASSSFGSIPIQDEQTNSYFVLVPKDDYMRLHDDYLRRELQVAFDEADRGEVSVLDMEAILAEAHRRHAGQQQSKA